jgi:hypothetical protein
MSSPYHSQNVRHGLAHGTMGRELSREATAVRKLRVGHDALACCEVGADALQAQHHHRQGDRRKYT